MGIWRWAFDGCDAASREMKDERLAETLMRIPHRRFRLQQPSERASNKTNPLPTDVPHDDHGKGNPIQMKRVRGAIDGNGPHKVSGGFTTAVVTRPVTPLPMVSKSRSKLDRATVV
jgi:hypothetical protein